MPGNIKNVITAIDYIESHLHEKLDLETVAGGGQPSLGLMRDPEERGCKKFCVHG